MDPRITLITLSGEIDLASERRLRADLSAAAGDPSRALILDLRGVTFIDSTGIAVLVHGDQQFRRQGRRLACVIRDDGAAARLLRATGVHEDLLLFRDFDAAAAHVLSNGLQQAAHAPPR